MNTTEPTRMAESAGLTFGCGRCGAQLGYDATTRGLKCPYCGLEQAVPEAQGGGAREIALQDGLSRAARGLAAPVQTVGCSECGATVNVGQGERTATCAFCGSHKVLAQQTDPNLIRPESMVPFQVDKNVANARFADWLGGLWFRPSDLKKLAAVHELGGVYVPFWTFDAQVHSQWQADAGYHYYETESYSENVNGQMVQRTRQVQKTRWQPAWGSRNDAYDDVLVCGSKGLPKELADELSTFDTKRLAPYQPAYLAGWRAESYAVDLVPAWGLAQGKIADEQRSRCGRDVPGDTQRNLRVSDQYGAVTFKHVLLPIWIAAYRYEEKVYRFLVNGQTGEVVGKAPWSYWKIAAFVLAILLVLAVIFVALQS